MAMRVVGGSLAGHQHGFLPKIGRAADLSQPVQLVRVGKHRKLTHEARAILRDQAAPPIAVRAPKAIHIAMGDALNREIEECRQGNKYTKR